MRGGSLNEPAFLLVDALNILPGHLLVLLPRKISIGTMWVTEKQNTDAKSGVSATLAGLEIGSDEKI